MAKKKAAKSLKKGKKLQATKTLSRVHQPQPEPT
jgi:hypothetical protein